MYFSNSYLAMGTVEMVRVIALLEQKASSKRKIIKYTHGQ